MAFYSARHKGISVWVLNQQFTSITKSFRLNIAYLVLFFTTSGIDMKDMKKVKLNLQQRLQPM